MLDKNREKQMKQNDTEAWQWGMRMQGFVPKTQRPFPREEAREQLRELLGDIITTVILSFSPVPGRT